MRTRIDAALWPKIKADYLTGQLSCRELSDKHKVSPAAISRRCTREGWADSLVEQNQVIGQTVSERVRILADEIAQRRVDHIRKAVDLSARLLGKIERRVNDLQDTAPIQEVRSVISAFQVLLAASETPLGIAAPRPPLVEVNNQTAIVVNWYED